MNGFNLSNLGAGLLAYLVGLLVGVIPLGYWTFVKLNFIATAKVEEEEIRKGNLAMAVEVGVGVLCQALLARHAVFAVMAVVRVLFVEPLTGTEVFWIILRSVLIWICIVGLAIISVSTASVIFKKLTSFFDEDAEIAKGNLAVAVFFSFCLIAITVILNDGMEDLSRSLIPFARTGAMEML